MSDTTTSSNGGIISRLFKAIGPGLVTACVVIGPGSILTSSKVGAADGFSKIWVVLLSVIFMGVYTSMGVKLGVVTNESVATIITKHAGRWLAVLIGLSVFFIASAYQFGNNLGVHAAINTFLPFQYWVIVFNALIFLFLFAFKDLYKALEKLMSLFVALMLLAFAINLFFANPNIVEMVKGINPFAKMLSPEVAEKTGELAKDVSLLSKLNSLLSKLNKTGLPLLGLIGTTFVISAAFYQTYLVRMKGWQEKDIKNGLFDARVSACIMALITLMIMCTAAAVFFNNTEAGKFNSVADVGNGLKPLFGTKGQIIFCIGLFSAAFSSFIVNSMIGGFLLADSLGLGSKPEDKWTRILTGAVLLVGMGVALFIIHKQSQLGGEAYKPMSMALIVAAQAATVLASPLVAGTLLWLTNKESIMGKHKNGIAINIVGGIGLVVLILMSFKIIYGFVTPKEKEKPAENKEKVTYVLSATDRPDSVLRG